MIRKEGARLNRQFNRMERKLPDEVGRALRWLRQQSSRWLRIPIGLALTSGGLFSFLPGLGLWMLPLGLLLLALDIPFLGRPVSRGLVWLEYRWLRWKRRRRALHHR